MALVGTTYDYPAFVEEVVAEIAKMKFTGADAARTYAVFLPRLAEKAPRLVNKQMSLLIQHLDNEVSGVLRPTALRVLP